MILEQNIRPKTIIVEVRNVKQNTWFEYMRVHKPDGWSADDISTLANWTVIMYYDKPTIWRACQKDARGALGMQTVRVKTLIGEQLFSTNANMILIDVCYANKISVCLPGESDKAEIIEGTENIKNYIQKLSKDNKGFASFHYVVDMSLDWGKLKCNNGNVYHIAILDMSDYD